MARDRERRGRAAERERAERQQRLIYIGAGAVLGIAGLLIAAGLFVTRYQPPRAHVVSVADRSYQARDVVDLGSYFFLDSRTTIADSARETVAILIEDEALRLRGPDLVAAVTAADIDRQLNIDLGLVTDDSAGGGQGGGDDGAAATASPTAEPTAEPTVDAQEFADALTAFLRSSGLDRDEYEEIIEARLYRERLSDHFTDELGTSGPQVRLQRIRVSTQLAADTVIEDLEADADFSTLADEESVADEDGDGGEIGWTLIDLQTADVQAAITGLEAGEWSAPITAGLFFEIYLVAETAEDRAYEDGVAASLASDRLDTWIEEAIASITVEDGLSADEETWINERVLADVTSRLGG